MPIKPMQQQHTIKDISPDQKNISYKCNRNAPLIYFELNTFSTTLPTPLAKFSTEELNETGMPKPNPNLGCPKTRFCGYFFCSTFGPIMSAINILAHCWGHEMQH